MRGACNVCQRASATTAAAAAGGGARVLQLERKPLDQIYKDWDKEDKEIKAKFKEHCRAMQELETAELASQAQIEVRPPSTIHL